MTLQIATTYQWVALELITVPRRAVLKTKEVSGTIQNHKLSSGVRVEHKAVTKCSYESTLRMS